jgi:hypothetical protein
LVVQAVPGPILPGEISGSALLVLELHGPRESLFAALHGENAGREFRRGKPFAGKAVDAPPRSVEIRDVILFGLSANPSGHRGGKLQVTKTPGPARRRKDIVEKPAIDLMAKFLKLLGVIKDNTRRTRLALSENSNGDQNFQRARSSYGQKGTSFITSK